MQFISDNLYLLLSIASVLIITLAGYAGYLLLSLRRQEQAKQQKIRQREQDIVTSITTILQATLQQQCGISEAVLRVKNLCDLLDSGRYPIADALTMTQQFYLKIQHHPILEARKRLPKKELLALDSEREELESQFESQLLNEFQQLLQKLQPK